MIQNRPLIVNPMYLAKGKSYRTETNTIFWKGLTLGVGRDPFSGANSWKGFTLELGRTHFGVSRDPMLWYQRLEKTSLGLDRTHTGGWAEPTLGLSKIHFGLLVVKRCGLLLPNTKVGPTQPPVV